MERLQKVARALEAMGRSDLAREVALASMEVKRQKIARSNDDTPWLEHFYNNQDRFVRYLKDLTGNQVKFQRVVDTPDGAIVIYTSPKSVDYPYGINYGVVGKSKRDHFEITSWVSKSPERRETLETLKVPFEYTYEGCVADYARLTPDRLFRDVEV